MSVGIKFYDIVFSLEFIFVDIFLVEFVLGPYASISAWLYVLVDIVIHRFAKTLNLIFKQQKNKLTGKC